MFLSSSLLYLQLDNVQFPLASFVLTFVNLREKLHYLAKSVVENLPSIVIVAVHVVEHTD